VITSTVRDALRGLRFASVASARQLSRRRIFATLVAIVILVAVAVFVPMPTALQLRDWATSVGPWFPFAFLAAHLVVTVFPFPRTAFTLAAGLLFGPALGVGLAVGVRPASGVLGVLVLFVFAVFVTLAFGALGTFAALRTGSGEAVQSLFPAFFVFLFISSMNIPRNLIDQSWFRDLATANPVSYLLECVRSLIITGWDGQALALGFGVTAVIAIVALSLSTWALRVRMARS